MTEAIIFDTSCDPLATTALGEQIFAMRPNGEGLRQLTDAAGFTTNPDGSIQAELSLRSRGGSRGGRVDARGAWLVGAKGEYPLHRPYLLAQARAASVVVDVQTKRLLLEQRRGSLISRDRAVLKAFAFARTVRDTILTWPARVGPQLAAAFELDAIAVTVYLDEHVRQLLSELASERVEF